MESLIIFEETYWSSTVNMPLLGMTEEVMMNSESRERLIRDRLESIRRLWEVVAEVLFYSEAGDKTVELKGFCRVAKGRWDDLDLEGAKL